MFTFRLLGGMFALLGAFVISLLTKIEMTSMMAMLAFILTVDSLILDWINYIYMKEVVDQMSKQSEELEKRNKEDDGSDTGS